MAPCIPNQPSTQKVFFSVMAGEASGGLDPAGVGGGWSRGQGTGCLRTTLVILHKPLLTHCLRHASLHGIESLI